MQLEGWWKEKESEESEEGAEAKGGKERVLGGGGEKGVRWRLMRQLDERNGENQQSLTRRKQMKANGEIIREGKKLKGQEESDGKMERKLQVHT